jgi:hypothetical protein
MSAGSSASAALHRSRPSRDGTREFLDTGSSGFGAHPTAATNDVVVPNKSRMREEEIEVPYARESVMERPVSAASSRSRMSSILERERGGTLTPRGEGEQELLSPQSADDRVYYDRLSFTSNLTSKSRALPLTGNYDERERIIRSEYEFRIAGLERKISTLEVGKDDEGKRESQDQERIRHLEEEVRGLKEVSLAGSESRRLGGA